MENKNLIGIELGKAEKLAAELNLLLADYQVFYQNLRGFHWNIRGPRFFELHLKFEELYTDAQIKIDEIAERVLTLGHVPLHTFSGYLRHSGIGESQGVKGADESLKIILSNLSAIVLHERSLAAAAAEAGDEGTVTLITDYISQQEKVIWMLGAYLDPAHRG